MSDSNKFTRPSKDEYYLNIAKAVAARSTCFRNQYGAIIVKDDRIISTGYNGSPSGEPNCCDIGTCPRDECDLPLDPGAAKHGNKYGTCVAVHAEQNAIINASRSEMKGATLYLACLNPLEINPTPCNMCDRIIKNSGITKVINSITKEK